MRIVHITDTYPPLRHPIADQVASLAQRQGARGDAVHVLSASPLDVAEPGKSRFRTTTTDAPGVRVHRLASRVALGLPVVPRGRATVERALALLRPDVVHLHLPGPSSFGYDAARAVRGMDLPLGITAYAGGPETFSKYAVRLAGWATAPVATSGVSSSVALQAAEIFGADSRRVLPLGTDLSPWESAGNRWKEHEDLRILVHAGDRLKKFDAGIDAALAEVGDLTTVTAVGPNADALRNADTTLGEAPDAVIPALASEHDVYVSAAALDPHAVGAAAAGMIVIGDRDTGVVDLVGGGGIEGEPGARAGGFLVATAEDVEHAIVKLAGSDKLRERMRAANLEESWGEELKRHDWAHVLRAADALYAESRERVQHYFGSDI